jgi:MFS family permease
LLRNKNLALLLGGQGLSELGNTFFSLAVFWYVLGRTHSTAALGVTGAALSLPMIFGLFAGPVIDRTDARQVMTVSDGIRAALCVAIALLATLHALPILLLLALLFCLELAGTTFRPAMMTLLPRLVVGVDDTTQANGAFRAVTSSAGLMGALAGGAIMVLVGPVALFFLNGLSFVISMLSIAALRIPGPARLAIATESAQDKPSFVGEWQEGVRYLWHDEMLRRLLLSSVTINMAFQIFVVLLGAWVKYVLHGSAFDFGLLQVGYIGGLIVGALLSSAVVAKVGMPRTMVIGVATSGILAVLFSQITLVYAAFVPFCLMGFSSAVRNTASFSYLQLRVPPSLQGRTFSTLFGLSVVANPLAAAVSGVVAQRISLSLTYLLVGVMILVSTMPVLRLWRAAQSPDPATRDAQ